MNTKAIREALELAKEALKFSVMLHPSFRESYKGRSLFVSDESITYFAVGEKFVDCRAFVAVCKAIEEMNGEEAK